MNWCSQNPFHHLLSLTWVIIGLTSKVSTTKPKKYCVPTCPYLPSSKDFPFGLTKGISARFDTSLETLPVQSGPHSAKTASQFQRISERFQTPCACQALIGPRRDGRKLPRGSFTFLNSVIVPENGQKCHRKVSGVNARRLRR